MSVSSPERIASLLSEVEAELATLQPKIDLLEQAMEKLQTLKLNKQRLIAMRLSLKSVLDNFDSQADRPLPIPNSPPLALTQGETAFGQFYPELAFDRVNQVLRQKDSINYELFRAIVYHGGRATTEQIKQFLLENNIRQPGTGDSFEDVALSDISSRINYLVRKQVVVTEGRGVFRSTMGWT
jgi:hypothetical protein